MGLSELALSIGESPTLKLNEHARSLQRQGKPVIHLGAGEPKSKVPSSAVRKAVELLETGEIRYTPTSGTQELKQAIARYTETHYGRKADPGNIIVSGGAKQALSVLLVALLEPGDEVVVLAPYWVSYPEMVKMERGVPVIVAPEPGRFQPTLAAVEAALTPRTKAVIVNSPNNPSGVVYTTDFVAGVVRMAEERGFYLIMDDIYQQLVFDGRPVVSAYSFTERPLEDSRVLVVNGVSKLYAMTGFRIGWAVAPKKIVKVMTNVQAQTTSCPCSVSQVASQAALEGDQTCVADLRAALEEGREVIMRELETIPGVRVERPGGTFYCLPDFSAIDPDSLALCSFLLEKVMVVTVPGKEFGLDGYLRLSFCGNTRDIVDGVARIRWAVDPSSPREVTIGGHRFVKDWETVRN